MYYQGVIWRGQRADPFNGSGSYSEHLGRQRDGIMIWSVGLLVVIGMPYHGGHCAVTIRSSIQEAV